MTGQSAPILREPGIILCEDTATGLNRFDIPRLKSKSHRNKFSIEPMTGMNDMGRDRDHA
jgi:hypothetical protein